jgi:hypothetical protein
MKKLLSQFLLLISFLSVSISPVVAQTWFNGLDVYDTAVNWINVKAVKNQASYSQILCSRATPRAQYGLGVYNPFPEHVRGKNTIVKVSGFVKIPGENSSGLYVVTLEKYGKTVYWMGIDLSKAVKDRYHWFPFSGSVLVPAGITRTGMVKAYLWNNRKKGDIFIDDLKFEFKINNDPSFLPEVKIDDVKENGTAGKVLFQNGFYKIIYFENDTVLNLYDRNGNMLVSGILYYSESVSENDTVTILSKWNLKRVKNGKGKTELLFFTENMLTKNRLEIVCGKNSGKIDFFVSVKHKKEQNVLRTSLLINSRVGVREVFRSNRQSDTSAFQKEYWLDKEGVAFGRGKASWFIYHTVDISSLQLNTGQNRLVVNLDYEKDHPFMRFPLQPDSVDWKVDLSSSVYAKGDKFVKTFCIYAGFKTEPLPRFMKNPYGYPSTYIWTEHADYSDIRTNRAVYFGNENIKEPEKATGGFVKYGIPVTKSVFYDNPDSVTNTNDSGGVFNSLECSLKDDTAFADFLFKIKDYNTEICLHTPEQYTTTRERLETALKYMQRNFGSKTWIDHGNNNGLQNNREDLICDGTIKGSPYYALDLWEKYGIKYLNDEFYEEMNLFAGWSFNSSIEKPYRGFGDFFPKPDYWKHTTRTGGIYHWPNTKVLYVQSERMWSYLFNPVQFLLFINNWGTEINHCYPARVNRSKAFWSYDAGGNIVSSPGFDKTLNYMKSLNEKGLLYLSTLQGYLDYRTAVDKLQYTVLPYGVIKITNTSDSDLKGLSFAVKAGAVLVNGLKPHQKHFENNLVFWFDLKKGETATIRCVN